MVLFCVATTQYPRIFSIEHPDSRNLVIRELTVSLKLGKHKRKPMFDS